MAEMVDTSGPVEFEKQLKVGKQAEPCAEQSLIIHFWGFLAFVIYGVNKRKSNFEEEL